MTFESILRCPPRTCLVRRAVWAQHAFPEGVAATCIVEEAPQNRSGPSAGCGRDRVVTPSRRKSASPGGSALGASPTTHATAKPILKLAPTHFAKIRLAPARFLSQTATEVESIPWAEHCSSIRSRTERTRVLRCCRGQKNVHCDAYS